MYRLSYRGHDFVVFVSKHLTEVTIEALDLEIVLECQDLSLGVHAAREAIDRASAGRPTRYLQRVG